MSELHSIDVEGRDFRTLASFELCGQKNGPAIMVSPKPKPNALNHKPYTMEANCVFPEDKALPGMAPHV